MRFAILGVLLVACTSGHPTPTGTVCPTPDPTAMGYDTAFDPGCSPADTSGACFGKQFMDKYCIQCHDSKLPISERNGAPFLHDFDTLEGVMRVTNHIDEQTGIGPDAENHFMPPKSCPSTPGGPLDTDCAQPTDDERTQLALWIACAVERNDEGQYDFRPDGGVQDAE